MFFHFPLKFVQPSFCVYCVAYVVSCFSNSSLLCLGPQLEVLAHDAGSCFVSHCGWNSTLEAISLGVPVVAIPQFLDQIVNAHFVEHNWNVGVVCKADENGFTCSDELERSINEVMHGVNGEEIKRNVVRWKELAKEAISEGGSSDKCIEEIIAELVRA